MSRMSGAAWVPLPHFSTTEMTAHNIICIHTMVGSLMGTDGYFRSITTGVNSHYGTGGAGEPIRQWGDTKFRSGANLNGNGDCITIEDADMGPGFPAWDTSNPANVPPFTDQQVEDIAHILAWESSIAAHAACPTSWACHRSGIPLEMIPDTLPGRRGIGYHRQGVDPYRVSGGVLWSSKYAKACPADRRYSQIPQIIARAKQLTSAPSPTLPEVHDMQVYNDDRGGFYLAGGLDGWTHITTPEKAESLQAALGPSRHVNDRQADVVRDELLAQRARLLADLKASLGTGA